MTLRIGFWISIALALIASGCGTSRPSRFYTLDSVATADGAPPAHASVMVGPVTGPAAVDQPQFVVQVTPNRVELEEFDRWAAPLDDIIARAVAGDLAALLGTPEASAASVPSNQAYQVTISVQRFESVKGRSALIDATWVVRNAAGGAPRFGRTSAQEPVRGDGFDALAAAHSRALARLSGDIAAAIRMESEQRI